MTKSTLTTATHTTTSLSQLGYASGVPGSPTHVPGFVHPGDGVSGLNNNVLTAAASTRGTLSAA